MSRLFLGLGSLVTVSLVLANAHCGGKVSGAQTEGDKDAGLAIDPGASDDTGAADDSSTRDDSSVGPNGGDDADPGTGGCPTSDIVFALGSSCDWVGTCTVALDVCDASVAGLTQCVCTDGTVQLTDDEGIACSSDPVDASTTTPPSGGCNLGAFCTGAGSTCTNAGAGPCGSDQRLLCGSGGVYEADGFPCDTSPNLGCGFGTAGPNGCSETCGCQNGLEICTGNCPDAGPASP
jgi:hypothetical protein